MTPLPRLARRLFPFVFMLVLSGLLAASPSGAACPTGHANPITSGSPEGRAPVIFGNLGDLDGDGRLTTPVGCEGEAREDVDCDGHVDRYYEDENGNGVLKPGEDRDGDRRLDLISEDLNSNGILDPGEDHNENGRLDVGAHIEDRNGDQVLNDRVMPRRDDVLSQVLPDGTRVPLPAWYPYGSLIPAPGGIVTALVAWNGTAYNLESMAASTRLVASPGDLEKKNLPDR